MELTDTEWKCIRHIIKATLGFIYDEELDDSLPENEYVIHWDKIKKSVLFEGRIYKPVKKQYAVTSSEKKILHNKILDKMYIRKNLHMYCCY